eukprot:Skav226318  [mRNA]  locus=scaffold3301:607650:608999:- [translate_table: standard]
MPAEQMAPMLASSPAPAAPPVSAVKVSMGSIGATLGRPAPVPPRDNLRIQGLPEGCTDEHFKQIFSQYANVVACKVVTQTPGREDCFGFMKFGSDEEAKYIFDTLNGNIPQGMQKPLSIKYASDRAGLGGSDGTEEGDWQCPLCSNMNFRRRDFCNICGYPRPAHLAHTKPASAPMGQHYNERPPNIQLYITGLPMGTTEESLRQFFFQYGEVYHAKALAPGPGKTVQSGFVRMPELEAQWCIENLHQFQPEGFPGPLTVEYARDKESGKKGGPKGGMGGFMGPKGGMGMGGMGGPPMSGSTAGGMDSTPPPPAAPLASPMPMLSNGDMGGKGSEGKGPDASVGSVFSNGGKDGGKGSFGKGEEGKGAWGWDDAKGKGKGKDGMGGMGPMGKGKDDGKGCGKFGKGGDPWSWGWDQGWDQWGWGDPSAMWGPMMMMMKGKGKGKKSGPY